MLAQGDDRRCDSNKDGVYKRNIGGEDKRIQGCASAKGSVYGEYGA